MRTVLGHSAEPLLAPQKAWVMFSDNTDLWWLRVLKPGFRHCAVLLFNGEHWVSVDPLSHKTDVLVHDVPARFDLPRWLSDRGHCLVPAEISAVPVPAPWMPFTCVEAVKRVLGIRKRFIVTPWQLCQFLMREHEHVFENDNNQSMKGDFLWGA